MSVIEEIEDSIQTLPAGEFFSLLEWMTERHLEMLSAGGFESPELEAEILKSMDGPRYVVDLKFFDEIRGASASRVLYSFEYVRTALRSQR